jgi:Domain of unknown function (DUF1883)
MNFLHTDFHGSQGDVALVTLDAQANVMLLDDSNFNAYRNGASFNYFGGWASKSPVRLAAPHSGHWHIVVDIGGAAGQVRASIRVVQRAIR